MTRLYGLVFRADISELEALVLKGDGIVENADQYIQNDAWTSFETVLAEAKTVLEDANATQDAVDTAAEDLAAAISALRMIPDKDALEALIGEAEAINTNKYTAKSVATMKAALSTAKAVLNDDRSDRRRGCRRSRGAGEQHRRLGREEHLHEFEEQAARLPTSATHTAQRALYLQARAWQRMPMWFPTRRSTSP